MGEAGRAGVSAATAATTRARDGAEKALRCTEAPSTTAFACLLPPPAVHTHPPLPPPLCQVSLSVIFETLHMASGSLFSSDVPPTFSALPSYSPLLVLPFPNLYVS